MVTPLHPAPPSTSDLRDQRPDWLTPQAWPYRLHALDHDGARVSYTDTGTGPTLLFVHVGMWSILWRDLIAALQGQYRCVTLDAPGNGLSQPATDKCSLTSAADAVDAVVRHLDLVDITLIAHDLGAPVTLEAAGRWPERVAGLAVINGFAWRPAGAMFRGMLATMGNPVVREFDAATGWLPRASATRIGVGRHWDRATRKVYRRGITRPQRRSMHRYMAAANTHDYERIDQALHELRARPVLTIFGQRNDPLHFQPEWKRRFPDATQVTIPKGNHFPMCDDAALVATTIDHWHNDRIDKLT